MPSDKPFVSFVIPTYNRAHLLPGAIDSVINQESDSWELVIVDDDSSDDTSDVVNVYADSRIKYVRIKKGERGKARNTGVLHAAGRYISFLDSDDTVTVDAVTRALHISSMHPEWVIFHFDYEVRDLYGGLISSAENLPGVTNELLVRKNVIGCHGIFILREILIDNPFSESVELSGSEDYELWLRLAARYKINHVSQVTAVLVEHGRRSMVTSGIDSIEKRIRLFIRLSLSDELVVDYLGSRVSEFVAWRFSYISLHAALSNCRKKSLQYLIKSFYKYPRMIFSRRTLMIIYYLFAGKRSNDQMNPI